MKPATIKVCQSCRFWSDLKARIVRGELQALCLCPESLHKMSYTGGQHHCSKWQYAINGAVDDPDHAQKQSMPA